MIRSCAVFLVACLLAAAAPSQAGAGRAEVERGFQVWLAEEAWPRARSAGVSRAIFDAATAGLALDWSLPDLRPPGSAAPEGVHRQSEFSSPARYFAEKNIASLAAIGRQHLERWRDVLGDIERRYGVSSRILIAIWGRESAFGRAAIRNDAIQVLATQAYMGARKELFAGELTAALQILERGLIERGQLRSSWAGALGQPQFLPSKFLALAVDFDGDGHRDIWNSVPDTLASIANYLRANGWQPGRDWGFEADVPQKVSCALEGPGQGRPIADWIGAGITRTNGRPFPAEEQAKTGFLLMPAGRLGPAFIATANFYVLKSFNESDLYALFIGHLADRLGGGGPFRAGWAPIDSFLREDVTTMQRRLEDLGHDVGGADGLVGFKTRIAIGLWQQGRGEAATCFPDAAITRAFR